MINTERSFTEYVLTEPTSDFVISFDRIGGATDEVVLLVDGTPITELVDYTVQQINFNTWRTTPALPTGTVVRLVRTTDLDSMMYKFTAGAKFIAKNIDANFQQIQHSQQEIQDRQDKLESDATALLLEINDVKLIAEQAAADANEALEKVDDILNTGVVPAGMILTNTGQNQQEVNDFGGAKWYAKVGGYDLGATVKLDSGEDVKSVIQNNTNDPNVDMAGWVNETKVNKAVKGQFILLGEYLKPSDEYIDDALDTIKSEMLSKGAMSGGTILVPRGIWKISRSHDLSVTGLRLQGEGGRYSTRIFADAAGTYLGGYVIKIAPTSTQVITGGSGLEKITVDLNEVPAIGLIYQGAYDVSALDRAEVINAHRDYLAALIEPHPSGSVIQTLKIDTSGFSKKSVGGTGYVVKVRMAQECIIINSKMFGSPSNQTTKGSVPLLLEDARGIQIIGGGFANSETNCIHIHAKTRSCTHVTIIGPTFEGFKAKAIKTWGDFSVAEPTVTNKVSRLIVMNERLISPAAGLLDASDLTFSTIYASNADIELKAGCTNNTVHTYDKSKVIDNGQYNEVIESPSTLNSNKHVSTRQQSIKMASTPAYNLEVDGRTGGYRFQWSASATVDTGAAIYTPNGSMPIRFFDDRLGFFGASPVVQRTSPATSATDTQKIAAIILGLEQLGLFKATT